MYELSMDHMPFHRSWSESQHHSWGIFQSMMSMKGNWNHMIYKVLVHLNSCPFSIQYIHLCSALSQGCIWCTIHSCCCILDTPLSKCGRLSILRSTTHLHKLCKYLFPILSQANKWGSFHWWCHRFCSQCNFSRKIYSHLMKRCFQCIPCRWNLWWGWILGRSFSRFLWWWNSRSSWRRESII